jgi:hypothetical protein
VSEDMTPAARRLLDWVREERRLWNAQANEDDLNTFVRYGAMSRRDQLDTVLRRLEHDLPDVECQAIAAAEATDELLRQLVEDMA